MADWYVSSAAYAAIAAFVPSVSYTLGQIVKPTAPALKAQWVFRCTTAGAASTEPTWPTANNATITTGSAVFTNVTGQSTYFWAAAAGDIPTLNGAVGANRFLGGDRMFVSSDHAENQTAASSTTYGATTTASFAVGQFLSVNRAGSTPPVAADLLAGASCTQSGAAAMIIASIFPTYHYGISYINSSTSSGLIGLGASSVRMIYFDTCQLSVTASAGKIISNASCQIVLHNTPVSLNNTANGIFASSGTFDFTWLNTPSAVVGGAVPTNLLGISSQGPNVFTLRGVDLSAVTTTLVLNGGTSYGKYLFDSCRIASSVTRIGRIGVSNTLEVIEFVNCFDGTNFLSERYTTAGTLTTETTITLAGGATDNVGTFSHKMVSTANVDKNANLFESFWMDVPNATIGGARTATVEIVGSASLNNDEISLFLEYQGTSGSSLASFVTSLPNPLATASAVTTSTATWNSLPATPVTQKLQVTFTPQTVGRVRGQVRLGKASTTVYIDPRLVLT